MTRFEDGPAKGQVLMLRRAPVFLRVTFDGVKWDALDLLEDTPGAAERLFTYRLHGQPGVCMLDYQDPVTRRRTGRSCVLANYRYVEPQPEDETMRNSGKWRLWCYAQRDGD